MLARERIGPLLFKLSVPAIIGMVVHGLYNLVDTIFIGRFVGTLGIGGTAIAFPVQMILMAVGMTLGIGGASIISRRMGAGDLEGASHALGNMVILSLVCGLVCLILGLLIIEPLLRLFGATDVLLPYARAYLEVILIGSPMLIFSMAAGSAARAEGNAQVAMASMVIGAVLNIILDPLFIILLGLGVQGAAIATVISVTVSSLFLIRYFLSGNSELDLRLRHMRLNGAIAKEIFAVGSSDFVRTSAMSLTTGLFNNILKNFGGEVPIAAFGLIFRILSFVFMPLVGIAQGAQPIIGFNYGAKQFERVKKGLRLANLSATAVTVGGFLVFILFPRPIYQVFSSDPELIDAAVSATRLLIIGFPLVGYQAIGGSLFQALGKARPALFLSLLRQVLVLIPIVLILQRFLGLTGVWLSFPLSDAVSFIVTLIMVTYTMRRLRPPEASPAFPLKANSIPE
jgi:putative MATE family efflux protein